MQEYFLRLFSGEYNTLYDSATSWIEPTDQALFEVVDELEDNNILISNEDFIEIFNAWIMSICDNSTAIGHHILDNVRAKVRRFVKIIRTIRCILIILSLCLGVILVDRG